MALYTYEGFAVFRFDNEERRANIYIRQNILMFLIHLACFFSIYLVRSEMEYLFFYLFQLILLYAAIMLFRMIYPHINRLLLNNVCMLLNIGFIMLTRLSFVRAQRQFMIAVFSLVLALLIPFIIRKLAFIRKLTWLYAAIGITALTAVLIFGQTTYGSRRSFNLAGVNFQPSEFVKILFVFFVAGALYASTSFRQIFTTMVVAAAHVIVLVVSRDLGSALILFVTYVLLVYIASGKWYYLAAGIIGGSVASVLAYQIFSHVRVRVQVFLDPWGVIDSQGYQITQSLFSISSGGLFGLGMYQGNPSSIPIVEADFIFSAIAEELGLIFAICVILICLSCFIMCMNIAVSLNDKFFRMVAFGLGITYITQVFLTIGGGTKFIPLSGVTLPLVSYGGTSILTTIILFFIIAGLYMVKSDNEKSNLKPPPFPEQADEEDVIHEEVKRKKKRRR